MIKAFNRTIIFSIIFLISIGAVAQSTWQILSNESSITFSATQNNSPVTGKFSNFSGEINFDPAQLSSSNIKIVVDMNSVTASYNQVADTLKTADWFNVKLFPQATFKSTSFTKTGDKTYQANGNLTIRDKTLPVTLTFTLDNYSTTKMQLKGSASLKRTDFGVGQGDWAKTDAVKDEVQLNFVISANKK